MGLFCIAMAWAAVTTNGQEAPADAGLRDQLTALVAQADGLKIDEVVRRAVDTSFDVRQREAQIRQAAAAVNQALVAYLPRLTPAARYARLSAITNPEVGPLVVAPGANPNQILGAQNPLVAYALHFPSLVNNTLFQVNLTVPLLDYLLRIPASHASAKHHEKAAQMRTEATRLQVANDARVLYYTWARARLQAVVAEQAVRQATSHESTVQHLFEAGSASKADVTRITAQKASSELFLAKARDLQAVLEDQLRTLMHVPPSGSFAIGEAIGTSLEPEVLSEPGALIAEAWNTRLEIKAAEESVTAARKQAWATRGGYLPHVDVYGDYILGNPHPRYFPPVDTFHDTWDVGIQASWVFNETANAAFATDGALAKADEAEAQKGLLQDALRREVVQALEAWREADLAIDSTARGLDAAEASYRSRLQLFENGRSTSVELTDAETDLTQARLDVIGATIDQRIARARLTHAVGRDLDPSNSKR